MSRFLIAAGAAALLAASTLAVPASAAERHAVPGATAASTDQASVDLSARRRHRYYRHYGYYRYPRYYRSPYYAYAPAPYYYGPRYYYRPRPAFFPFFW